jgi:6-carboxyhexanoate--CoA ligase
MQNQYGAEALISIKMRAAQGGPHERGGRHISGEERIVTEDGVEACLREMLERARTHQRGRADFMNLKLQFVDPAKALYRPMLAFSECEARTVAEGRETALRELVAAGVSQQAARAGIQAIAALPDSMRGAMVMDCVTGERLDHLGSRGVRVSNMDVADPAAFRRALAAQGLHGDHVREALVLASKVAGGDGVVAEVCWSDDPQYVVGYVGSPRNGYRRIPVLKEKGCGIGGRVFYVRPGTDLDALRDYYEEKLVFITAGENGYVTPKD